MPMRLQVGAAARWKGTPHSYRVLVLRGLYGRFWAYAALLCVTPPGLALAVLGGFVRREVAGLRKYAIKPIFSSLVAVRKWSVRA